MLSGITGAIAGLFAPIVGKLSDSVSPKLFTPACFLVRGVSLISLVYVVNPLSIPSYIIWAGVFVGVLGTFVAIDGYFACSH